MENKKYYKILRNDMTHRNFQYQEGLNVDINPFNENPTCYGGLFFSNTEHILEFCDYGDLIANVEIPENEQVVQVGTKYKAHSIILRNIRPLWNTETFQELIKHDVNIHTEDAFVLRYTSQNGYFEIVNLLVKNRIDIHARHDEAIRLASANGYFNIVEFLIKNGANIHEYGEYALRFAALYDHLDIVKLLVKNGADIHAKNDFICKYASPTVMEYLKSII